MEDHEDVRPVPSDGAGDDPNRRGAPRRRGRRGRGTQAPPFRPPSGPAARPPWQPARPQGGVRPPREEDEGSSQAREISAYERRQQQQQRRGQGWRPPGAGGGGFRPQGTGFRPQGGGFRPQGGGFRPQGAGGGGAGRGGGAGPRRGFGGGGNYAETIRRVTAGPRVSAPSHDSGEPLAGPHAVLEAMRSGRGVRKLYVSQDRGVRTGPVNELIAEAQEKRIFVNYVDKLEIARLSPIENHQGVVAIVEGRPGVELDELLLQFDTLSDPPLALVVDSLQDPQNFGVLLRSAEGAGVDGVVIPRHRAVGLTAAVARTSAGASEHLLVADVANLRQAIDALKDKGIWVVGADESGDLLYDEVDYRGPTAIVIGGEGEGIRRLVLEGCDQVVRIPMTGQVSSLNAAAAGTVILYEALRQRSRDVAPPETRTPRPTPVARDSDDELDDMGDEAEGAEELDSDAAAEGTDSRGVVSVVADYDDAGDSDEDGADEADADESPVSEEAVVAALKPARKRAVAKKTVAKPAAKPRARKKPAED